MRATWPEYKLSCLNRFFISEYFPATELKSREVMIAYQGLNRFFISEYFPA